MKKYLTDSKTLISYETYSIKNPYWGKCMALTRELTHDASIIIPFNEDLNRGVNEKTIKDWVDLGNNLIFPATLSTGYFENAFDDSEENEEYKIICKYVKDIVVKPKPIRPNNGEYYQADAYCVGTAYLININHSFLSVNNAIIKWGLLQYVTDRNGFARGGNWNIDLRDFETVDTGECLFELVTRLYKEYKENNVKEANKFEKDNAYVITVEYSKGVSSTHKLAMTMFYRYLYSYKYNGIVYHTLEAIKQGVNPWDALMLSHKFHMPKYASYYGLLFPHPVNWYSMEESLERLKTLSVVNNALTKNYGSTNTLPINWGTTDTLDYSKLLKESKEVKKLTCIIPSKTLIKDKQYDVIIYLGTSKGIVQCEDFVTRKISLKRFQN